MNKPLWIAGAVLASVWLAGCNSSSSSDRADASPPQLRVLHASPDAPNVNVRVNGSTVLEDVPYKTGSGYLALETAAIEVAVDARLPGGTTATVIGPVQLDVSADAPATVVAFGPVADLGPLVVTASGDPVEPGQARVQVLHAAADAPDVDVYVVEPGTGDPLGLAPLGGFAAGEILGPVSVPAGEYRILVTPAGSAAPVVFDSGPISLADGADLLLAAVSNTGPGAAPISLVGLDGTGSFEILDTGTPASLRVVHASPDAPAVDVVVNNQFASPLVAGLAFPGATGYLDPAPGDYNVKVGPTGQVAAVTVIDADLSLAAGQSYTVIAAGPLAAIEPLVLTDDRRAIATEARVRLVHGSPSAGPVDIYVTAPGTDLAGADPAFADVPFKAETGYVALTAGDYEISVTPAGDKTVAIGPVTVSLEAGHIYGAIARDAAGGGGPLGLILLDGFAP
ncbi:DUF4397 domain-containing protein [Thioalkalivibrio thiocyanodenitrificans]|uniref:DUF4397 domain-containing protein n=1 Tax=Thioalkalivibrio thiocyanodenitrificans TaxID=243063 RepID=UPI000360A5C3|nr:DUF4397 domain-containing protein [Thioalkalivibrio thiocyanodenitrificans]